MMLWVLVVTWEKMITIWQGKLQRDHHKWWWWWGWWWIWSQYGKVGFKGMTWGGEGGQVDVWQGGKGLEADTLWMDPVENGDNAAAGVGVMTMMPITVLMTEIQSGSKKKTVGKQRRGEDNLALKLRTLKTTVAPFCLWFVGTKNPSCVSYFLFSRSWYKETLWWRFTRQEVLCCCWDDGASAFSPLWNIKAIVQTASAWAWVWW